MKLDRYYNIVSVTKTAVSTTIYYGPAPYGPTTAIELRVSAEDELGAFAEFQKWKDSRSFERYIKKWS